MYDIELPCECCDFAELGTDQSYLSADPSFRPTLPYRVRTTLLET